MFVLLFLSGVPMAEGKALKKYYTNGDELTAEYEEYRSGAPPVIICCPPLYRALYVVAACFSSFLFFFWSVHRPSHPRYLHLLALCNALYAVAL